MTGIQNNRFYNSPELGAAFSSLAQAFAPPSGSELASYAQAGMLKTKTKALEDALKIYNDPAASFDARDRAGIAAGLFSPNQSYYDVDQRNLTDRRGQDVTAATSRANNAADNERALQVGAMDNRRQAISSLFGPLSEGQIRPTVPGDIAAHVGLPAIAEAAGTPKPLSETEWQAQQNERLRQSGALTDDLLLNAIAGKETPVQAMGPDDKPRFMSPGQAVRTGAEPYNPSGDKSLIEGTAVVGGRSVQVFRKPNDSTYYTADGKPLAPDVQVFDKAKPTGTNEQLGMKPTEFTTKNGMFGVRAEAANATMNDLIDKGYLPSSWDFEMSSGVGQKSLPTSASNTATSAEGRQFYNAGDNFILSIARPDTGAAISNEEQAAFRKMYIPLPGDDAKTLANKRQAREIATAALSANSAGAAEQTLKYLEANNVPIPDELRARLDRIRAGQADAPSQQQTQQQDQADPLAAARAAIARGAPREKVVQRLRENGINPEGL